MRRFGVIVVVLMCILQSQAWSGITRKDRGRVKQLAAQYVQASIRGDADAMYEMSSSLCTKTVSREAFKASFAKLRETAIRTGIVHVGNPVVRGDGLMGVQVEFSLSPQRGPHAGTHGMSDAFLYARLEDGAWKIIDLQGVQHTRYREFVGAHDLGRVGEGLIGAAMGFPNQVPPYVDVSRPLTMGQWKDARPFSAWPAQALRRLRVYGDLMGSSLGEVIEHTDSLLRVRFDMTAVDVTGKRSGILYQADLRRTEPKWLLLRIRDLGAVPCPPDPLLDRRASVWKREAAKIGSLVTRRLQDWVEGNGGEGDSVTEMMNSGVKLKQFGSVKVLSIRDLALHPYAATATASADLRFTNDAPPGTRSGLYTITLKQTGDPGGRWEIGEIEPVR